MPPARTSAVIFRIHSEWLALPTEAFQEVAERRRIHSLPHRRNGVVLGLVNIRGELLICVDLGRVLGIGAHDSDRANPVGRGSFPHSALRTPHSPLRTQTE